MCANTHCFKRPWRPAKSYKRQYSRTRSATSTNITWGNSWSLLRTASESSKWTTPPITHDQLTEQQAHSPIVQKDPTTEKQVVTLIVEQDSSKSTSCESLSATTTCESPSQQQFVISPLKQQLVNPPTLFLAKSTAGTFNKASEISELMAVKIFMSGRERLKLGRNWTILVMRMP